MKQRTRVMISGDEMNGYGMGKKDDDDNAEIQLHKMKPIEHFIEAQVQEGDTLQAIALRFYCSISELKRINHIHKDNEIYARRTIKVPVTPYSVLTELIPSPPPPQPQPEPEPVPSTSQQINPIVQDLLHNNHHGLPHQNFQNATNVKADNDCAIDCNTVILNSTVAPSVIPYCDNETTEDLTEDTQLLPSKQKEPVEAVVVKHLTSQGADYGIKWFHLVCVMVILGVVAPLVYVMFFLDKHEHPLSQQPT